MSNYCKTAPNNPVHAAYHNTEYGFPVSEDRVLFERLAMEIMQAGLSWEIVLKKRKALNKSFNRFSITKVAAYDNLDVQRLMGDASIIRNRLKILAVISNAQRLLQLQKSHGSFVAWIDAHHPQDKTSWIKLFKKTFKFMGGEIVGEFLMSTGYLTGSHHEKCPVYKSVLKQNPPWKKAKSS